jgi:hypothetical protein
MGRFVNPDNSAFQAVLNSRIYVDKTEDFKKHLNKYDVIHIDVQWFLTNCEDADNVVSYITRIVLDELRDV